jgi:hypothetical protein
VQGKEFFWLMVEWEDDKKLIYLTDFAAFGVEGR